MVHTPILYSNLTPVLVVAILGVALIFLIRIALPESSGSYAGHMLLHAGGLTLATFITGLAVLAYRMMHSRRLLLTAIAFANFMLTEMLLLIWAFDPTVVSLGHIHSWELGHLLMFVTLGLLALGVLRDD